MTTLTYNKFNIKLTKHDINKFTTIKHYWEIDQPAEINITAINKCAENIDQKIIPEFFKILKCYISGASVESKFNEPNNDVESKSNEPNNDVESNNTKSNESVESNDTKSDNDTLINELAKYSMAQLLLLTTCVDWIGGSELYDIIIKKITKLIIDMSREEIQKELGLDKQCYNKLLASVRKYDV